MNHEAAEREARKLEGEVIMQIYDDIYKAAPDAMFREVFASAYRQAAAKPRHRRQLLLLLC